MVKFLLTHEVENTKNWKEGFDKHASSREKAGFTSSVAGLVGGKPNTVWVLSEAPNMDIVHNFINSPDTKETMKMSGVTSEPEIIILNSF